MKWMKLEPILQSEISQKEKNTYCILMHIDRIYKILLMDLFAGKERRCRHKNKLIDTVGVQVGQIEKVALTYIHYNM